METADFPIYLYLTYYRSGHGMTLNESTILPFYSLGMHSDIPGEIDWDQAVHVHISEMRESVASAEHEQSALLWKCRWPRVMICYREQHTPPWCDGIARSSSAVMISPRMFL